MRALWRQGKNQGIINYRAQQGGMPAGQDIFVDFGIPISSS